MRLSAPSFSVLLFLSSLSASPAAVLVNYNFSATEGTGPTSVATNLSATSVFGATRSTSNYGFQYPITSNPGYMEFTLSASAGFQMDLSSFTFSYDFFQSSGTSNPVSATFTVKSSNDSYSASLAVINDTSGAITGTPAFTAATPIDLTSFPNQNAITFRIILANGSSLNANIYRYAVDSLTLNGTVISVPEPNVCTLLVAGTCAMFVLRRSVQGCIQPGIVSLSRAPGA